MAIELLQADLVDFHEKHFSSESCEHFSTHFLGPVGEEDEGGDDDGLGYYPDGVKRTLTDEQIAIFRHSEIQSLLRERRYAQEAKDDAEGSVSAKESHVEDADAEEGEVEDVSPVASHEKSKLSPATSTTEQGNGGNMSKKQRKAQYAKEKGFFKQKIKPDLRKRTWDKVDTGMDSLMYDDGGSGPAAPSMASQRRKISYDDD